MKELIPNAETVAAIKEAEAGGGVVIDRFDVAEYLDSPEVITEYLREALDANDPAVLAEAVRGPAASISGGFMKEYFVLDEKGYAISWNSVNGPMRHPSFFSAEIAAKECAQRNPGQRFFIVATEAVVSCDISEPKIEKVA